MLPIICDIGTQDVCCFEFMINSSRGRYGTDCVKIKILLTRNHSQAIYILTAWQHLLQLKLVQTRKR